MGGSGSRVEPAAQDAVHQAGQVAAAEGLAQEEDPRVGETGEFLASRFNAQNTRARVCSSLREAVTLALPIARPGEHVVFSPGFASFDMFRNYVDRGRQFEALVAESSAASHRPSPSTIKSPFSCSANAGLCLL